MTRTLSPPSRWTCLLLPALVALVMAAAPAQAQSTVTVCAASCDHTTIQAAIAAASAGDIVDVAAGTYSGLPQVTIDKALTLRGAGSGSTTIDVAGAASYGISTNASDVTLEGFTVSGNGSTYNVKISGLQPGQATGIVVDDVVVTGSQRTGIDVNGVVGLTISNVTVSGTVSGNGVALTDVSDATLTNITTSSNAWGGLAIYTFGRYYPLGSDNVVLSNVSGDEANPVYVQVGNFNDPANPAPVTNLVVPTGEFPYEVLNAAHRAGGEAFTFYNADLTSANTLAGALNGSASPNTASTVEDRATGAFVVTAGVTTIQAAVDVAEGGDTIEVGAGTFAESLILDKALTLSGANAGTAGDDAGRGAESRIEGSFTLGSDDVTIDGFEFANAGAAVRGGSGGGVNYSGIAIRNNAFVELTSNSAQFITNGFGSGGAPSGGADWTIADNLFDGIAGDNAAVIRVDNVDGLTVTGNVARHDDAGASGRRGFQIDNSQNVLVDGNTVDLGITDFSDFLAVFNAARYSLQLSRDDDTSARTASNVTISNNTFSGSYDGVVSLDGGTLDGLTVTDNTFTGFFFGVRLAAGSGGGGAQSDIDVSGNTFSTIQSAAFSFDMREPTDEFADFTAQTNTFNDAGIPGIRFINPATRIVSGSNLLEGSDADEGYYGGTGVDDFSGFGGEDTFEGNESDDLLDGGLGTDTAIYAGNAADFAITASVDGAGAVTGFTAVEDLNAGDGDEGTDALTSIEVLQFADATYSVGDPVVAFASGGGFVGSFATIQAAVDAAPPGGRIEVAAGTYAESFTIADALTLNGPQAGAAVAGRTFADAAEATIDGLIDVDGSNVTIDGFSLTGPDEAYVVIIDRLAADIDIVNNFVQEVGTGASQATSDRGPNVHAIYFNDGPDRVTVADNAFRAIRANGRTVSAVGILDSTGSDCSEDAVVTRNTFNDITSLGSNRNWGSYAVIANHCTVDLQVTDNVIDGIEGEWSHAIGLEADSQGSAVVTGNEISNLVRTKAEPDAVAVFFQVNPSGGSVEVSGNSFTGTMDFGVALHPDAGGSYTVDAEGNWWGAASGPSGEGPGTGVGVAPSVDFDPWIGKAEEQAITQRNTPTTYSGGAAPATLTFSTLPSGGGSVSVATFPGAPAGVPTPPGAPIAFSIEMTSTMTNYDFEVEVSIDVSGIAGFGPDTRIAYYSASTGQWVTIDGEYAAGPPATFTFTTDHFTPFAFYNTPATAYDVFVVTDPTDLGTGAAFPNDAWAATPSEPDDWSLNGAPTVAFFVAPEVGSTFFSSSVTLEWDPAVLTYVSTDATGGLYDGADRTFFADEDDVATGSLTVDGSRLDVANFTTSAGEYLARVEFTVAAPGNSPVDLTGMRFRAYDGSSGQEDVFVTAQGGELKAYLGDVATTGDASTGDGLVDFEDLTLFSGAYWSAAGDGSYKVKYDVGPTATNTVFGLPDEDGEVEFEDLVIFSISYGLSNTGVYPRRGATDAEVPSAPVAVSVGAARAEGGTVRVPVLVGEVSDLRALSVGVGFDAGLFELVGAERPSEGPFAGDAPALHLARATAGGAVADAATFGTLGVSGEGAALELVLRPTSGLASDYDGAEDLATLTDADLRSTANAALPVAIAAPAAVVPDEFFVSPSYPNPVRSTATLEYGLAEAGPVEIVVFDALGRQVLTLVNGEQEAGVHTATVDAGSLAPGLYVSVIRAGAHTATQRITVVR